MIRAISVSTHGTALKAPAGVIELDSAGRRRRRFMMTCSNGLEFLLDLEHAPSLHHGDRLVLEDGRHIEVVAAAEPLAELTAGERTNLITLAYHIGNRHLEAQLLENSIFIRPDHVIEDMIRGLGGVVTHVTKPFEPVTGAYGDGHHHA